MFDKVNIFFFTRLQTTPVFNLLMAIFFAAEIHCIWNTQHQKYHSNSLTLPRIIFIQNMKWKFQTHLIHYFCLKRMHLGPTSAKKNLFCPQSRSEISNKSFGNWKMKRFGCLKTPLNNESTIYILFPSHYCFQRNYGFHNTRCYEEGRSYYLQKMLNLWSSSSVWISSASCMGQ